MEHYKNLDLADINYFCEYDLVSKIEQWTDVIEYDGIYNVSDLGRIKSLSRYRGCGKGGYVIPDSIRRQTLDSDGYLILSLYIKGVSEKLKVHRLVAQAFIPNPENKSDVNHIKGIKTDNRVTELEWNTKEENKKHAKDFGLLAKGESHTFSKLTNKEVLEIRASNLSHTELAVIYNSTRPNITKIINRQRWTHI